MTALLTNSRLRCFRECSRKHQLAYVDGWRPAVEPEALRFGSLIHTALEQYWLTILSNQASVFPTSRCVDNALEAIRGRAADLFEQARADEMVRGYAARWLAEDYASYEVLAVEPQFETPLWNPMTNAESRTWRLAGKIDAIVKRRADQRKIVVEHKTSSEDISDGSNYWPKLALDHQCSIYALGAESLGHSVDEIMYDVLLKPAQRPLKATPVEERKFTKEGVLYKNQREFDETPDEYRLRVREAIMSDLSRYFQRRAIPRTMSQIREFLIDAWQQGRAMRDMELDGYSPRNPEACHRFGTCQFWSLCSTGADPAELPGEFVKKDSVNPELEESK